MLLGGAISETKSVVLYAKSVVPTLLNYGNLAKLFLNYNNGIYLIPGERISNFYERNLCLTI